MTDKKDFSHILSPIKIGPVELKNRISPRAHERDYVGDGRRGNGTDARVFCRPGQGRGRPRHHGCRHGHQAGLGIYLAQESVSLPPGAHAWPDAADRHDSLFRGKGLHQMTIGFGRQGHSCDHHKLAPAPTAGLPYEITADKTAAQPRRCLPYGRTSQGTGLSDR